VRHDKDIVSERKGEGDRLRGMEEARQQGVKDEWSKRDKRSEIRLKMSTMLKELTKEDRQQGPQHIDISPQVIDKKVVVMGS